MNSKENSKVHQEQSTSSSFSCSSLSKECHMLSTMECSELNNAKAEAESESSFSFTQSEDSSIESGNNALEDEDDKEVSLNELLLDGKTKKKIELLAAMVGVDTTEPAIVLTEVVRILRVLKAISHY